MPLVPPSPSKKPALLAGSGTMFPFYQLLLLHNLLDMVRLGTATLNMLECLALPARATVSSLAWLQIMLVRAVERTKATCLACSAASRFHSDVTRSVSVAKRGGGSGGNRCVYSIVPGQGCRRRDCKTVAWLRHDCTATPRSMRFNKDYRSGTHF